MYNSQRSRELFVSYDFGCASIPTAEEHIEKTIGSYVKINNGGGGGGGSGGSGGGGHNNCVCI